MKDKDGNIVPFSNGSDAESWYWSNCGNCAKAFLPKDGGEYPPDETMKKYIAKGFECPMKYALDMGFITGCISVEVAKDIGYDFEGERMPTQCSEWRNRGDDGNGDLPPNPQNVPDNQLVLPFILDEIGERKKELA